MGEWEWRPHRSDIEAAPFGVFVVDGDGALVDVNPAGCEMLGYERAALLEQTIADLNKGEPLATFHELQGQAQTELELRHRDGHTVHVAIDAVPLEADRTLCYVRDISERVACERRLEESEARYRSMTNALDTSNVGTFILDDEFTVVWITEAIERFFGLDRDAVVGTDKTEIIQSQVKHIFEDPERFAETVLANYEDNSYVESFTCHVTAGEGREERWLQHWSAPIEQGLYAGGRIEHYTDITAAKTYEHRIEEQRDNLRILNEVMRHDIRNDLQLVLANADFLADSVDEDDRSYVETIQASAEEAVELTRTARETAEMMLDPDDDTVAVNLRTVLEGELTDLRARNPGAVVTTETTIPPVTVRANEMLGSVFRNLLNNAIQHNDSPVPAVRVAVSEGVGSVAVRVVDNGPGVADDRKEEVFGKDEKGLHSTGTGLGLYLVRTLVERYGGQTWVEDREDGENGAVFVVELPTVE